MKIGHAIEFNECWKIKPNGAFVFIESMLTKLPLKMEIVGFTLQYLMLLLLIALFTNE